MNQDRLLELLGKKSAGELTLQEQIELNQLLQVDTDARSFAAALEAILTTSTTYRNAVSENETEDFIQKVHSKISKKKTRVRKLTVNWKPISAVAAILLLVFVGGIYYWGMNTGKALPNVVVTKKGNKTNIVLPDGTKVYLNYDASYWNISKENIPLVTPEDQGLKHSWDGRDIWRILLTAKSAAQKKSVSYKIYK